MATTMPVKFSYNGNFYAYTSADGSLKIWETNTGTLKHEYTPSSHLSASCSCFSWGPTLQPEIKKPKKKKRQSLTESLCSKLMLIALGTASGDILLYSLAKAELHTQLSGGHNGRVNDVCWSKDGDILYSCSEDQHIVEWDIRKSAINHKWSGDKKSIHAMALCHTERHLLTAGRSIKLWDLEGHQVLQTYTGHATEVFSLLAVPCAKCGQMNGTSSGAGDEVESKNSDIDGSYFFSTAVGDRLVNAWQVSLTSSKCKSALASFSLPDEAVHVDFRSPATPAQTFALTAITNSGQLYIFEHQLNGRCKEPLKPRRSLEITSSHKATTSLPILAAYVTAADDRQISVVYGNLIKPAVETMSYSSLTLDTKLVRSDPMKQAKVSKETEVVKTRTPVTSGDVTVLGPGHMVPAEPSGAGVAEPAKTTKRKRLASVDMTMAERLDAMSLEKPPPGAARAQRAPTTDTLATLLAQGLHSNDQQILNSVLNRGNPAVIRNTVRQLPLNVIVPFMKELTRRVYKHAQGGLISLKWVRAVLTTHTAYLMAVPELVESVSALYQLMDSRCATFSKLARLKGKLDLMLSQISTQEEVDDDDTPALLVYQDESSDEEVGMEDFVHEPSESEDNWDVASGDDDASSLDSDDEDGDDEDGGDDSMDADVGAAASDAAVVSKRRHSDLESSDSSDGEG